MTDELNYRARRRVETNRGEISPVEQRYPLAGRLDQDHVRGLAHLVPRGVQRLDLDVGEVRVAA